MIICCDKRIQEIKDRGSQWFDDNMVLLDDGSTLNLLQLSDLHYSPALDVYQGREVLDGLLSQWTDSLAEGKLHGAILSGDILDAPSTKEQREEVYTKAFQVLQKAIGGYLPSAFDFTKRTLVIPGNHDIQLYAQSIRDSKHDDDRAMPFFDFFAKRFHGMERYDLDKDIPHTVLPKLVCYGNQEGICAVIGLDSNHLVYEADSCTSEPSDEEKKALRERKNYGLIGGQQLDKLEGLVTALSGAVQGRPLYCAVVLHHHLIPMAAVSDGQARKDLTKSIDHWLKSSTLDGRALIEKLQALGISLVLHGHMHDNAIIKAEFVRPIPETHRNPLNVVACPSYKDQRGLLLSIDLERGSSVVNIFSNGRHDSVTTTITLKSLSKISPSEFLVYKAFAYWLEHGKVEQVAYQMESRFDMALHKDQLLEYKTNKVDPFWQKTGYTPITIQQDNPTFVKQALVKDGLPKKKYKLLLLFMRDAGGKLYILLNNHTPLRKSDYGQWDTLLLPAFHSMSDFLSRLKQDMLDIQHRELVTNIQQQRKRKQIIETIETLQKERFDTEEWLAIEKRLELIETSEFVKFSPTEGRPFLYEYELVSSPDLSCDEGYSNILTNLSRTNATAINEGAIRGTVGYHEEPVGPGAIWFPFEEWEKCFSIKAKNADVMDWIGKIINDRKTQSHYGLIPGVPNRWVLGAPPPPKASPDQIDDAFQIKEIKLLPFKASAVQTEDTNGLPTSLEAGLRKVYSQGSFEKSKKYPPQPVYSNSLIKQVILIRKDQLIQVYDGDEYQPGVTRDEILSSGKGLLGKLRPTQRYVLTPGMQRVQKLGEALKKQGIKPNKIDGYLQITFEHTGRVLAHLPPIIESITPVGPEAEFLVCDGNHRIVHYCWREQLPVRAALITSPSLPYYAYPFGAEEWFITHVNERINPPDLYSKYAPRILPDEALLAEYQQVLGRPPSEAERSMAYRWFFRRLETGFGDIGGQGGRPFG